MLNYQVLLARRANGYHYLTSLRAREVRLSNKQNWYVRFYPSKVYRNSGYDWRQPFIPSFPENIEVITGWSRDNEIEVEIRPELVFFKNYEEALLCYLFFA